MKTSARVCAVLLFFAAISFSQDHAPTVEQCRADQRLWSSQLDTPEEIAKLSFRQLQDRVSEMITCAAVDDEHGRSYNSTAGTFNIEQESRLFDFVKRHNLFDQFLAEDAAGKR